MPIRFTCPNPACGKSIAVKDEYAGRNGKCPGCQTVVKIPAPAAPPEPAFEVVEHPEPVPAPAAPRKAASKAAPAVPAARPAQPVAGGAGVEAILNREEWYVREDGGLFSGNTVAGLFESPDASEPLAVVRNATRKLFGFFNLDVMGYRPRAKFEVRERDKNGPVVLTLERFVPRFELPFAAPKPSRWEVRGPGDAVIGSVAISRQGFSLFKFLAKGRFFQGEHLLLDAGGERAGRIVIERGAMASAKRLAIVDEGGEEYGAFGTQFGRKVSGKLAEAEREGKRPKGWVTVSVMGEGDEDERGMIGRVNPDRAGEEYARVMTFALTVMFEVLGLEPFLNTSGRR